MENLELRTGLVRKKGFQIDKKYESARTKKIYIFMIMYVTMNLIGEGRLGAATI